MGHHHGHSRRDFFRICFGSVLAGDTVFEEAFLRAGWARAQAQTASGDLFTIEKVAEGVFAALAKPQALTNSNAAIFVLDRDVLVVDAHSKPSAAAALLAQIKREVSEKPVTQVPIPATLARFAAEEGLSFRQTLMLLDMQKQIVAHRSAKKKSQDGLPPAQYPPGAVE